MTGFAYAESWAQLFAQGIPFGTTIGVPLSPVSDLRFSLQIAYRNTDQSVWDSPSNAQGWDSATWDDGDFAVWVDVTHRVRGLQWDRGSAEPLTPPEVATATITLDNTDGEVSPWAITGSFTNPIGSDPVWDDSAWDVETIGSNASLIRPGTPVRFGVTVDPNLGPVNDYTPWFTGLIEAVNEDTDSGADAWVTLSLIDIASTLAAVGTGKTPSALTDGSTGDEMLQALVAEIAWPYFLETFEFDPVRDPSPLFQSAPQLAPATTANRLQAAQAICAAGDAVLFATSSGTLVAVDGNLRTATGDVWSNDPAAGELPIPIDGITGYSSSDRLLNTATGTRAGDDAVPQTAIDAGSVGQFGTQSTALNWPKTDLPLQHDPDVLALASRVVDRQADDFLGISAIEVDADMSPALWRRLADYAFLGAEAQSTFTVRWVHPSGNTFVIDVYLIGFSFSLTMEGGQGKFTGSLRTAKA